MRQFFAVVVCCTLLLVNGCGGGKAVLLGPKTWKGIVFTVEPRPFPLRVGMNEFILIANRNGKKPVVDLVVSYRVDKNSDWQQAIQDGFSGVYRRAIHVGDPKNGVLEVQIRKINKEAEYKGIDQEIDTVLHFPLNQKQK
jgi:hypothetical protein